MVSKSSTKISNELEYHFTKSFQKYFLSKNVINCSLVVKDMRQNDAKICDRKFTNYFERFEILNWFKESSHVVNVFQKIC